MFRRLSAATAALALAGVSAAGAQPQVPTASAASRAATERDLRCVIVMGIFSARVTDAELKLGAAAGLGYFMGKVKGREPAIDLKARLLALAANLDFSAMQPEFTRCGDEVKAFGAESTELGRALQSLGAQTPGQNPAPAPK